MNQVERIAMTSATARSAIEAGGLDRLLPSWSIHGALSAAAACSPNKAAIRFLRTGKPGEEAETTTYHEFLNSIERAAGLFQEASDGPAVVSVLAPLLPEAIIAMWGAAIAGVCNPINPFLETRHIASIMNAARSTVLVTCTDAEGAGAWNCAEELVAAVPTLRRMFVIHRPANRAQAEDFTNALRLHSRRTFESAGMDDPNRVCAYFHTGGTTSAPKLVQHTQRGQLLNAWISASMLGPEQDEIIGLGMPNFHVAGAIIMSLRALIMGQTLLILTSGGFRNPEVVANFWEIARSNRITSVAAVPTSYAAISAAKGAASDGHCIRTFSTGGGAMPRDLARAFEERFGVVLKELWGMTEFQGILSSNPYGLTRPRIGSVGLPNPFHKVKVVLLENGRYQRECANGEKGTLVVSGPCMTPGYLGIDPSDGLLVRDMPGQEGWLNTGDLGALDPDGYVWIYGREKDVIIRGGHNLDPGMVEEVLNRHPSVQVAAVVGQPDPMKGELPIAYVQLKNEAKVSAEELLALCAKEVPERAAVPAQVVILDQMPVTAVGKIFKPPLRLDAMVRVAQQTVASVLGTGSGVKVEAVETTARPTIILRLPLGLATESCEKALQQAFAGYLFETRIVLEETAQAA
ncbi:MAG: AMP-binding protein [Acidobacteriaceae bacterium]|nr:AMP-binding protein [Acidobacteriaceae bacterium]